MMKQSPLSRLFSLFLVVFLAASGFSTPRSLSISAGLGKIDPRLMTQAEAAAGSGEQLEFLISMRTQADLSAASALRTKTEKGKYVYQKLTEVANRTQPPILKELAARGLEFRSYWIANLIWVRGDLSAIQALAQRSDVAHLEPNPQVQIELPSPQPATVQLQSVDSIEPNLLKVKADKVWALGDRGQGVVIAGADTGYQWDHPALKNQYRGWDGSTADHNYSWHDAIHQNLHGTNRCGADSKVPCDDYNHGTHTMGIMVGDDGAGNQIGMAPQAKWIGCRNMDNGVGSPQSYTECFQWFLAPTDLNDQNPDPSKAPDVINNSWSCTPGEGCVSDTLQSVVDAVRAAGIVVVVSAGNSGSSCSSVNTPPGIYDSSVTVGNTDNNDLINPSSSRGPVTIDGSGRLKPDISAPGTSIRSSIPVNQYTYMSGTSMAAPHVSGLVALLISASPALRGQVDQIESLIKYSAQPLTSTQACGGVSGQEIPNNTYGWGRIDAYHAVVPLIPQSISVSNSAYPPSLSSGGTITYTLEITRLSTAGPAAQVILTDTLPANSTFLSATQPYTLAGDVVRWDIPSLDPGAGKAVELVLQAPQSSQPLVNRDYGVQSSDLPFIYGLPVITPIEPLARQWLYFPFVAQQP